MQIQPRKQKWSKVALHFHINIMYVNLYTQLIYRFEYIHKDTMCCNRVAFCATVKVF